MRRMGKQSRRKAEKRAGLRKPTEKESIRKAFKADRRGRESEDSIEEYERLGVLGPKRLAETLISRHTRRMESLNDLPPWFVATALSPFGPVSVLDRTLVELGIDLRRFPASFHGTWADHAAWGIASNVATARLMLAGQLVGAAAIARQQIERWGLMRASVAGLNRADGESIQDFLARAWSHPAPNSHRKAPEDSPGTLADLDSDPTNEAHTVSEPQLDHLHVYLSDGTEICPAVVYGVLSEIMHGDECRDSLIWDVRDLLAPDEIPDGAAAAANVIADAMSLSLSELKFLVAALATNEGEPGKAGLVIGMPDRFQPPDKDSLPPDEESPEGIAFVNGRVSRFAAAPMPSDIARPPLVALMPLLPREGLDPEFVSVLARGAKVYEEVLDRQRPAGRLFRDDEMARLAFVSHRYSSALGALEMMERERDHFGDDFNIDSLTSRASGYLLVGELTGVAASWSTNAHLSAATALVASSMRSAFWLWLEDDDRAMAVLRCTFEQTARMRVWRLKPARAAKLEVSPSTTPKDWLHAAGWKRLTPLSRALSEFSHAQSGSRWDGARWLLAALQVDADPETSMFTARGSALDLVVTLMARETVALIRADHSAAVADVATELFEDHGCEIAPEGSSMEALLNHVWSHRAMSLGPDQFPKFD